MKGYRFTAIIDALFSLFIYYFLFFILLSFIIDKPFSAIISVCLSLIFTIFSVRIFINKQKKSLNQDLHDKQTKETLFQLKFMKQSEIIALFYKSFASHNKEPINRKEFIFLPKEKTLVFFHFSFTSLTKTDIVKVYNTSQAQKKIIYTDELNEEILSFSKKLSNVQILGGNDTFKLLSITDNLPSIKISAFPQKERLSLSSFLDRKKSKTFFGFGLFFILSSYFVPYKLYYVISSFAMFTICLLSLFFGKRGKA